MEYEIRVFEPKSASNILWDNFLNFGEEIYREEFPGDPVPSKEEKKKSFLLPDPRSTNIYWTARLKDQEEVIGSANLMIYEKNNPAYEPNKHMAFLHVAVSKTYRRQGIATAILTEALTRLKHENKSIVQGGSHQESGRSFCASLNGKKSITEEESRLNVENIDWDMLNEWRKSCKKRTNGATIEQYERIPEENIAEFCQLYTDTLNLIPKGELEWEAKETPEIRRATEERYGKLKTIRTTFISREKDGTLSGLTETFLFYC